jgi:hypothetical protein
MDANACALTRVARVALHRSRNQNVQQLPSPHNTERDRETSTHSKETTSTKEHHIYRATNISMDRETVYSLDLWGERKSEVSTGQESNIQVQKKLVDFILSFAVDNAFIYRYVVLVALLLRII